MFRRLSSVRALAACALSIATATAAQAAGPFNVTALPPPCASAIGNDLGDDTAAFQCALSLVPATGRAEIYIPAGTFLLSQQLTIADKSIAFRGDGQRISILRWTSLPAGDNGLQFDGTSSIPSNMHRTLAVRSLSLLRGAGVGGAAIRAVWPNLQAPANVDIINGGGITATIEDVHIGGEPWVPQGPYWDRGIWLVNATATKIHTFNVQSGKATLPGQSTTGIAGIHVAGSGPGGRSLAVTIHDGSILGYPVGVRVTDRSSGLHAQNVTIRDAQLGFELVGAGTGASIANSLIVARWRGIFYSGDGGMAIANNHIYRELDDQFIGIDVNCEAGICARMRIIGNMVFSPPSVQELNGIVFTHNVRDSLVEGNTTHNMTRGIWLNNGLVMNNLLMANLNRNAGTAIVNSGVGTVSINNW